MFLVKGNRILLGKRKASHGIGEYACPGGHFEYMESVEESIMREFREEVGDQVQVKNLRFLCITNLRQYAPRHYLNIGMTAEWVSGEPMIGEPEKLESWDWYDMDSELPENVFGSTKNYVTAYKTGQDYFTE